MAAEVEVICPPIEELSNIDKDVPCPVPGCTKILPSRGCLQMHVVKTHNIIETDEERRLFSKRFPTKKDVVKQYYCPVTGCARSLPKMKPFPRLGQLKQHYLTMHGEKKFICSKCKQGFGMEDMCLRHQENCGKMFPCSCGCPFTSRRAMLVHARRNNHPLPEGDPYSQKQEKARQAAEAAAMILASKPTLEPKPKKKKTQPAKEEMSNTGQYCLILPKPPTIVMPKSTADGKHLVFGTPVVPVIRQDNSTQTASLAFEKKKSKQKKSKTAFSQTEPYRFPFVHHIDNINQSSIGVQANDVSFNPQSVSRMLDFACGTEASYFNMSAADGTSQTSIGTQLDGNTFSDLRLLASNISGGSGFVDAPLSFNSCTQTCAVNTSLPQIDAQMLSSCQTQTGLPVSLEDNAAQTSISILDLDATSTDCGTQTKHDNVIDELLDQTSDVELTESQTQTWLSGWVTSAYNQTVNQNISRERAAAIEDPGYLTDCGTQTKQMLEDIFDQTGDVELTESQTQTWITGWQSAGEISSLINQNFDDRSSLDEFVDMHTQTSLIMPSLSDASCDVPLASAETQTIPETFSDNPWVSMSINTQTQMTQTAMGFLDQFQDSNLLMDTHTQTIFDNVTSLSSVQTQT